MLFCVLAPLFGMCSCVCFDPCFLIVFSLFVCVCVFCSVVVDCMWSVYLCSVLLLFVRAFSVGVLLFGLLFCVNLFCLFDLRWYRFVPCFPCCCCC